MLTRPQWTAPAFTLDGVLGIVLPLFIVTMAAQNIPGIAILGLSAAVLGLVAGGLVQFAKTAPPVSERNRKIRICRPGIS